MQSYWNLLLASYISLSNPIGDYGWRSVLIPKITGRTLRSCGYQFTFPMIMTERFKKCFVTAFSSVFSIQYRILSYDILV